MDRVLLQAEYVVSLATNDNVDEIRANYKSVIVDFESAAEALQLILEIFLDQYEVKTSEEIFQLIENEYSQLNLSNYLGNFEDYRAFILFLLRARINKINLLAIDDLKEFYTLAGNLNEGIAYSIYYVILQKLTFSNLIVDNINFTKEVINHIRNSSIQEKFLLEVIHSSTNH